MLKRCRSSFALWISFSWILVLSLPVAGATQDSGSAQSGPGNVAINPVDRNDPTPSTQPMATGEEAASQFYVQGPAKIGIETDNLVELPFDRPFTMTVSFENVNLAGTKPTLTYLSFPRRLDVIPTDVCDKEQSDAREATFAGITHETDTGKTIAKARFFVTGVEPNRYWLFCYDSRASMPLNLSAAAKEDLQTELKTALWSYNSEITSADREFLNQTARGVLNSAVQKYARNQGMSGTLEISDQMPADDLAEALIDLRRAIAVCDADSLERTLRDAAKFVPEVGDRRRAVASTQRASLADCLRLLRFAKERVSVLETVPPPKAEPSVASDNQDPRGASVADESAEPPQAELAVPAVPVKAAEESTTESDPGEDSPESTEEQVASMLARIERVLDRMEAGGAGSGDSESASEQAAETVENEPAENDVQEENKSGQDGDGQDGGSAAKDTQANETLEPDSTAQASGPTKFDVEAMLSRINRALNRLEAGQAKFVASSMRVVQQSSTLILASSIGGDSVAQRYVSADSGLAYIPDLDRSVPYQGINLYLRPVNPPSITPLGSGQQGNFAQRFSFTLGLTVGDDLVQKETFGGQPVTFVDNWTDAGSLLVGVGYRLNPALRVGAGAIAYRELQSVIDLQSGADTEVSYYFSVSLDVNVRSLFRNDAGKLFSGGTPTGEKK